MNRPYNTSINEVTLKYYVEELENYCDELEMKLIKYEQRLRMLDAECFINPCEGCTDYCYKNNECKSNGGCAERG